jgi:hypothetical protein
MMTGATRIHILSQCSVRVALATPDRDSTVSQAAERGYCGSSKQGRAASHTKQLTTHPTNTRPYTPLPPHRP